MTYENWKCQTKQENDSTTTIILKLKGLLTVAFLWLYYSTSGSHAEKLGKSTWSSLRTWNADGLKYLKLFQREQNVLSCAHCQMKRMNKLASSRRDNHKRPATRKVCVLIRFHCIVSFLTFLFNRKGIDSLNFSRVPFIFYLMQMNKNILSFFMVSSVATCFVISFWSNILSRKSEFFILVYLITHHTKPFLFVLFEKNCPTKMGTSIEKNEIKRITYFRFRLKINSRLTNKLNTSFYSNVSFKSYNYRFAEQPILSSKHGINYSKEPIVCSKTTTP